MPAPPGTYNYIIAPMEWRDSEGFMCWQGPVGSYGNLDLRGLSDQRKDGGTQQGHTFAAMDKSVALPRGAVLVGDNLSEVLSLSQIGDIEAIMQYSPGDIPSGSTLLEALELMTTVHGDVTGEDRLLPFLPTTQGNIDIHLGGHSLISRQKFRWDKHHATDAYRQMLRHDLAKKKTEMGRDYMKVADYWREQLRLPDYRDILPEGQRGDRLIPHETSVSDNFNRADEELSVGNWTEVSGDMDIVSNEVDFTASIGLGRYDTALSSGNHFVQGTRTSRIDSAARDGLAARVHATNNDLIAGYALPLRAGDDTYYYKVTAGSFTLIGSAEDNDWSNQPIVVKLEVNGSTLQLTVDSVDATAQSDSTHSTNVYTGISGLAGSETLDDWSAEDLAAGAVVIRRRLSLLGVGR